jgi:acyl-coenzyme A synthetase/AMP-(fatty) acid ligase
VAFGQTPADRWRWQDLLGAAARLRRRAFSDSRAQRTLITGDDRFAMLAAALACWDGGGVLVLPPNRRPDTLRELMSGGAADRLLELEPVSRISDELGADHRSDTGDGGRYLDVLAGRGPRLLATFYTSGSTGTPVACRKTAGQLLGEAEMLATTFQLGTEARVLSAVPAHHIYGFLFGVLAPVLGGGAFATDTVMHPEAIADRARAGLAEPANVLCSVPPHVHGLRSLATGPTALRRLFCSGGRLPAADAAAVHERLGLPITEVLGSTETGGMGWRLSPGQGDWTPLPGVEVGAEPDGTLLLRSPFLAPEIPQPFRGADHVQLVDGGKFRHLGRSDGVVKVAGQRVSLTEIEDRLRAIPGVEDAAVVAVADDGPREQQLWAAVVAPQLDELRLRRALLVHVEPVAVPRRFRFVARLPRESTGKLPRGSLMALFEPAPAPADQGGP